MREFYSKKIAIIGANGFLGNSLIQIFKLHNINFSAFDKNFNSNEKEILFIDVEDMSSLDLLEGYDTIINLAAVHRDDVKPVSKYDDVNIAGAKNICDIASKYDVKKIIFTSSVAIYGFAAPNTSENGSPNYFNDYGRTKYEAEKIFKKWQKENSAQRSLVIIRPTVIFGENNRGNVFNLINQIYSKRFIFVGNGKNKKSMAYVENVVAFIKYTLSLEKGLYIYNYIDKPDMDMNELVSFIRKILFNKNNVGIRLPRLIGLIIGYLFDLISFVIRKPLPVSSIRVQKFTKTTQFASSEIDKTDFQAPYSLRDALKKTIEHEFYNDNDKEKKYYTE